MYKRQNLHKSKGGSAKAPAPKQFQMLIDIQAKMAEGKTVGYEKWAKKFNRKEADVYKRQKEASQSVLLCWLI